MRVAPDQTVDAAAVIDLTEEGLVATIPAAEADYATARQLSAEGRNGESLRLIMRARDALVGAGALPQAQRLDLGRMHVLNELGRHRQAVDVGVQLRRSLAESPPDEDMAWVVPAAAKNLGVSLGFLGDHAGALSAYAEAEEDFVRLGMDDEVAPLRTNQGIEQLELGRAEAAARMLHDSVDRFLADGDGEGAAEARRHLAEALAATGRMAAAQRELRAASAGFAGVAATTQVLRCRLADAALDLALGLVPTAAKDLQALVVDLADADLPHDLAVAQVRLGSALAHLGQMDSAGRVLGNAIITARRVSSGPLIVDVLLAQVGLARIVGDAAAAVGLLDDVDAVLSSGDWPAHGLRAAIARADLALAGHRDGGVDEGGVDLAAANRALDGGLALLPSVDQPTLVMQVRHLQARAALRDGQRSAAIDLLREAAARTAGMGMQLRDPIVRLSFMDDKVRVLDDLVAALAAGDAADQAEARTVLEARKTSVFSEQLMAMSDDRAMPERKPTPVAGPPSASARPAVPLELSFQVHEDTLRLFTTRGSDVMLTEERPAAELASVVRKLSAQWQRQRVGGRFSERHQTRLRATTDHLLAQLADIVLGGVSGQMGDDRPVVISADGILHDIPFGALRLGDTHLVDRVTLSMVPGLPSSSDAGPIASTSGTLVVGVADQDAPAIEREVSLLGERLDDAAVLLGAAATASAVVSLLADAPILHLAGHARYVPAAPMQSAIALADGWVTAMDLAAWPLHGRLVVLSACGTARSAPLGGERLGLARAALAAGAAAVVVAKWDIPDGDTVSLMADFHRRLASGASPVEALRDTQRAAAESGQHPYRWAAFEVVHA